MEEIQFQKKNSNTFAYVTFGILRGKPAFKVCLTNYNPETDRNEDEETCFLDPKSFTEMMENGLWVASVKNTF